MRGTRCVGIIYNPLKDSNEKILATNIMMSIQGFGIYCILVELSWKTGLGGYYNDFMSVDLAALQKCDLLICLGGDGTKNFLANTLIHNNLRIPFIGISNGTMNVSKLTSILGGQFDINKTYKERSIDAISIKLNHQEVYYAFHDVIFATTFVSTYNMKITQLSAKHMVEQKVKIVSNPDYIGTAETRITVKRCIGKSTTFPPLNTIGVIGVANIDKVLGAKVLAGGVDHPATVGAHSGIVVSPEILVWPSRSIREYQAAEPICSYFSSFDSNDEVEIENLNADTYVIIDGNAIRFDHSEPVWIGAKPNIFSVLYDE